MKELKAKHLGVVREIHEAFKKLDPPAWSVRNCSSLVDGYARAEGFDEALAVWEEMRKEGGVGIDERCISIVRSFFLSFSAPPL